MDNRKIIDLKEYFGDPDDREAWKRLRMNDFKDEYGRIVCSTDTPIDAAIGAMLLMTYGAQEGTLEEFCQELGVMDHMQAIADDYHDIIETNEVDASGMIGSLFMLVGNLLMELGRVQAFGE